MYRCLTHRRSPATLYVGCYTTRSRIGVHTFSVGPGATLTRRDGAETDHASFLAVRGATSTIYAVRETTGAGAVVALRIGRNGLEVIDEVSSLGDAPCHVSTHGDRLFVANYASGSVAAYALLPDGRFGDLVAHHQHHGSGPHVRQQTAHAHCVVPAPDGRSLYAVDLGTDRVLQYVTDGRGRLSHADDTTLSPGAGPRHLAFHPTLPVAFIVCELDCTLVVADVDSVSGRLTPRLARSTLPADTAGESLAAEVVVHPDGGRVYVSTRGCDIVTTFAFDGDHGYLEALDHVASGGVTPRHIALHPSGELLFVAHQDSDSIVAFDLAEDGLPQSIGTVAEVSQPVCLAFGGSDP